jgi:hypothetical protein
MYPLQPYPGYLSYKNTCEDRGEERRGEERRGEERRGEERRGEERRGEERKVKYVKYFVCESKWI